MLHQNLDYTPRYAILKTVTYLSNQHLITYSNNKLVIFSREILQHLQINKTFRNYTSDIVAVASSRRKGSIVVFCEKEIIAYNPTVSGGNTLRWVKAFQKNCSNPIRDAFFSNDDQYIIGCTSNQLNIWKVDHQKNTILDQLEQNEIKDMKEIFNVELSDPIKNVKFSPDGRFFSTMHMNQQKEIMVWDFEAIRAFPSEGDIEQLPHAKLKHQTDIISYKLRETSRVSPSPLPTPNTIVTLTSSNTLNVWQEQPFQSSQIIALGKDNRKSIVFFKLHTVYLQNVSSFCFIYGYNQPHSFPWVAQTIEPDSIGVQDIEDPTVDYILVHQDEEVQIIKLELLRNYSLQTNLATIHQYTNSKFMKSMKKIIYANQIFENNVEKLEIIGFDRLWNITKLIINLSDQSDFRMYSCEKFTFEKIIYFSFDELTQTICLLNNLQLLCHFKTSNLYILNDEYEVRSTEELSTWKNEIDTKKYVHMFHAQDIVLFLQNTLEEILLLQLNKKFLVARQVKISNIFQKYDKENLQFDMIKFMKARSINQGEVEMIFLLLRKTQIITLKMVIGEGIFVENQQNQHIQINYSSKVTLTMPFQRILFNKDYRDDKYNFFTFDKKNATYCEVDQTGVLQQTLQIQKQFVIDKAGCLNGEPKQFYITSQQNDIDFHNNDGEFLARFSLGSFLVRVDSANYDLGKLILQIHPIGPDSFLIAIENYVVVGHIVFDKLAQIYKVQILKNQDGVGRNENYCLRLSKHSTPQSYQFFNLNNGNILIKTICGVRIINNSLENRLKDPKDNCYIPQTINYKFLSKTSRVTFQDPIFLSELYQNGKQQLINYLVHLMVIKLRQHGSLGNRFTMPLKDFFRLYQDVTLQDYEEQPDWLIRIGRMSLDGLDLLDEKYRESLLEIKSSNSEPNSYQELLSLRKILQSDQCKTIGLQDQKLGAFQNLIEYTIFTVENQRSLDFWSEMFLFYVNMFRNQPRQVKKQGGSLSSREIVWALHSIQKDTLWQECIEKQDSEEGVGDKLIWQLIRRYCAVIWMDNIEVLKAKLEKIALANYKEQRNPFAAMLYYVILGKKSVIAMLFKKEMVHKQEYKNTYEFLMKDFNDERWIQAASKNAYALISKKRYQDACSFFLLGGHLEDAVNVIAVYLEDIQLALLCARIHEQGKKEQPITKRLINEYFIKSGETMNDIWLLHIGYHLLGQYVDSVNILYRKPEKTNSNFEYDSTGRKICQSWSSKYEPQLSCFHPSAILFAQKVQDTLPVKREIQWSIDQQNKPAKEDDIFSSFYDEPEQNQQEEEEQNIEIKKIVKNIQLLKEQALEYYYNTQMPLLGMLVHKCVNENDEIDENAQQRQYIQLYVQLAANIYLNGLINQQIQLYVNDSLKEDEHYTNYVILMQRIDEFVSFMQVDRDNMYRIAYNIIQSLRSPCRILTFSLHYDVDEQGFRQFESFCNETQSLLFRLCFCYAMNAQTKEFYGTLLQAIYELDTGLKLFQQSKFYQFKYLNDKGNSKSFQEQKNQLNIIKLYALFISLLLTLELNLWQNVQDMIRKVYFLLFYYNIKLEIFCHEVFSKQNLDWCYENQRDDFYESVVQRIRVMFTNTKTKSKKAHRSIDLLAEAFPEDKYDLLAVKENNQKQQVEQDLPLNINEFEGESPLKLAQRSTSRNVCCELILCGILKTLTIKYFLSISKHYFQNYRDKFTLSQLNHLSYVNIFRLAEQYQNNRSNQVVSLLWNIKDYIVEQKILDDISNLTKNDQSYHQSEYFQQLAQFIEPVIFHQLSQKIHLENYSDLLSLRLNRNAFKYPRSIYDEKNLIQYKNHLFKQGVEVYRTKIDLLRAFCVNQAQGHNQEAVVLQGRLLKKTNLLHNLVNRNRTQDGYCLLEEETIQSDDLAQIKDETLLTKPFIVRMASTIIADNDKFADKNCILQKHSTIYNQYQNFTDKDYSEKFQTYIDKNLHDFSEHQNLISHPYLPIFFSGAKGTIDLFSFKSTAYLTDYQTGQKEFISQIKLNNHGDMLLGVDEASNSFVWKMHKPTKSNLPIFQFSGKTRPCTDMCFVNEGSVIATIYNSSSKHHFAIYDLLLPPNKNTIVTENFSGTNILFSSCYNSLIISNAKKGVVNFYDLRKNQIYQTLEIPFCEIKFIGLNHYQNKVICACNDSSVKTYSLERLEQLTDVRPFRQDRKTPQISNMQITENLSVITGSDGSMSIINLNQ